MAEEVLEAPKKAISKGKKNIERRDRAEINKKFIEDYNFKKSETDILNALYRLRAMRISDLANLTGGHLNWVRQVVRDMHYNRLIERKFYYEEKIERNFKGSSEGILFLDEGGVMALQALYELEKSEINWEKKDNQLIHLKVKHLLETSKIIAKLTSSIVEEGGEVLDFFGEKHLKIKYRWNEKVYEFCPDAYIKVRFKKGNEEKIHQYFIENDTGGMTIPRFLNTKIKKYEDYFISRAYLERYETYPTIIVVTSNIKRVTELATGTLEKTKPSARSINWIFTTNGKFHSNPLADDTFVHTSSMELKKFFSLKDFEDVNIRVN